MKATIVGPSLLALSVVLLAGCTPAPVYYAPPMTGIEKEPTGVSGPGQGPENLVLSGLASYYGNEFAGRKTASGEKFDPDALTAAHRTLPFGTMVKVTNVRNKKSVVVKINDRGPWMMDRIIDLSYGSAKAIGLLSVGKVTIEVLAKGEK